MGVKKNILILGGFGFIGSNIIESLLDTEQFNIFVFEFGGVPSIFSNDITIFRGDFHNAEDLEFVFKNQKIDMVIHLISTTVPVTSNDSMEYDIDSNLIGTIRLLNLMSKHHIEKIVFFSSGGTVYGDIHESKASESHSTNPISSHGIIKLTVEKYINLFNRLSQMEYLIFRVSNPYGEYHNSDRQGLINVAIKKVLDGQKVEIWGDGTNVRDFIYVKDLAAIVSALLRKNVCNEVINIGSGIGHTINEVLSCIADSQGQFEIEYQPLRKYDVPRIVLDIGKLNSFLKFDFTDLRTGISNTLQWYKNLK